MTLLDAVLKWGAFILVCLCVLVAPWFFGAWEMWWFWPFAACVFGAFALFSVRAAVAGGFPASLRPDRRLIAALTLASLLPFLGYALIRMLQAAVYMTAERSVLLFVTGFLVAIVCVFGMSYPQRRLLYWLIVSDLCAIGLYGILNQHYTNSRLVLWVVSDYSQYAGRATGPYFCPDHFAGLMEILLGLALGLIFGRSSRKSDQDGQALESSIGRSVTKGVFALPMVLIALVGVAFSQSRGGILTVVTVLGAASFWAFSHLPLRTRWLLRLGAMVLVLGAVTAVWHSRSAFVVRFKGYFRVERSEARQEAGCLDAICGKLRQTARYNMYSGAFRAWRTAPVFGVGPGMHQHLWPHFAASPDGDRTARKRPSRLNTERYSYEVHSDWLQLLEEYGIVGFALFVAAAGVLLRLLLTRSSGNRAPRPAVLGSRLAFVAMAFHSLGDFNLQIPATVWLLAAILSLGAASIVRGGS